MDSSTASSNRGKSNLESSRSCRVRIVGRVRDFTEQESESSTQPQPWISVCKSGEGASSETRVRLSCSDQSASRKDGFYRLDYCYEQDEDTSTIFSNEIKPLICDVLNGENASVIAYGAKGSGKTFTIQGTEDKPGLAVMSMNELLTKAKETGNIISVSILEVHQEHVYDLLDPKCSEIQILGNGQGKINLKGLTQVPVKCANEFQNMYFNKVNVSKSFEKIPLEQPKRNHRCLMVHVSRVDGSSNLKHEGKMLFIDLAGYEDSRRCSRDGNAHQETSKTNISLQAVMNVVHALNANEIHVPYRESKLTRIFQEFVGGIKRVVMLTCLNPHFCRDTIHTLSVSSRSCQSTINLLANSERGDKGSARSKLFSSQKSINPSTPSTVKKQGSSTVNVSNKINPSTTPRTLQKQVPPTTPRTLKKQVPSTTPRTLKKQVATPNTFKKQVASTVNVSAKKTTASKGRQLFDDRSKVQSNFDDEKSTFDHALTLQPEGVVSEDNPTSETSLELDIIKDPASETSLEFDTIKDPTSETSLELDIVKDDASADNMSNNMDINPRVICANVVHEDGGNTNILSESSLGEENKCNLAKKGDSPPLSVRLQELSMKYKSLCISTPLSVKIPEDFNSQPSSEAGHVANFVEPKTPEFSSKFASRLDRANYASPWERINARSSGIKDSLVHECLTFLNTAGKEELKGLKGIGEKRATYILELRDESPEPFKDLDDLQNIGLSAKQVRGIVKNMAGDLLG